MACAIHTHLARSVSPGFGMRTTTSRTFSRLGAFRASSRAWRALGSVGVRSLGASPPRDCSKVSHAAGSTGSSSREGSEPAYGRAPICDGAATNCRPTRRISIPSPKSERFGSVAGSVSGGRRKTKCNPPDGVVWCGLPSVPLSASIAASVSAPRLPFFRSTSITSRPSSGITPMFGVPLACCHRAVSSSGVRIGRWIHWRSRGCLPGLLQRGPDAHSQTPSASVP